MAYNYYVTRDDMVEYVRSRLGHPVIEVELELAEKDGLGHVHLAINDALSWMFRHNQDESDYADWMIVFMREGIIEYDDLITKIKEYIEENHELCLLYEY